MRDTVQIVGDIKNSSLKAVNNITGIKKTDSFLAKYNIPMWLIIFSLICSFIAVCGLFISKDVIIHKESIVLTFIGILATFVVVSNYVQIKEIKDSHEAFVKEYEEFKTEHKELKSKLMSREEYDNFCFKGDLINFHTVIPADIASDNLHIDAVKQRIKALRCYLQCRYYDSSGRISETVDYIDKTVKVSSSELKTINDDPSPVHSSIEACIQSPCPFLTDKHKEELSAVGKRFYELYCKKYNQQKNETENHTT